MLPHFKHALNRKGLWSHFWKPHLQRKSDYEGSKSSPVQVVRSLVQQGVVLSDKLSPDKLGTWLLHHHFFGQLDSTKRTKLLIKIFFIHMFQTHDSLLLNAKGLSRNILFLQRKSYGFKEHDGWLRITISGWKTLPAIEVNYICWFKKIGQTLRWNRNKSLC